jgi:hypothetical protein
MSDATARAMTEALVSPNETDANLEPANVTDGLFAIARSIDRLGTNGPDTNLGAVELLAVEVRNGLALVADRPDAEGWPR